MPAGAEDECNLWPYIIAEIITIISLIVWAVLKDKKNREKEKVAIVEEKVEAKKAVEVVTVKETMVKKKTPPVSKKMPDLYNYSFQARRHLMDDKTLSLYNMLKNHIMCYEGISVNQTWDHEIFMKSGRAFAKLRFHGKTFKLYLDVNARDYTEPKFPLIDESKVKAHETTPTLLNIKGPRMLQYGLDIIDEIAARLDLKVCEDYIAKDYNLKKKTARALFDEGLIKSSDVSFTLQD